LTEGPGLPQAAIPSLTRRPSAGKPLRTWTTRARKNLTKRDKARAIRAVAGKYPALEVGYYDIVLTTHPSDARYDVDSVIEVA
jgi:hypothetical protein